MPRSTYRDRLEALIANAAVSRRDRDFATSLLGYYERKGRLSAGRVKWVTTLEERYSPENLAASATKNAATLKRLSDLQAKTEDNSWASGFVESLTNQVTADRRLSERQIETLKKIESEHTPALLLERQGWVEAYKNDPTLRERAVIVANYYKTTGYFQSVVSPLLSDDTFVPTLSQYNKIVKNKYAQKVLAAHDAPAKYQDGALVQFRASAPWSSRSCDGTHLTRTCPMVVIAANVAPIISAARGAKVYRLLPVGKAVTIEVEERHIMKARKLKPKKEAETPS